MPSPWSVIRPAASGDRGDTVLPPDGRVLALTAGELSQSWGAQPASATLIYSSHLGPTDDIRAALRPVTVGSYCTVTLGPYVFHGRCKGDAAQMGQGPHVRVFEFEDLRGDLQMDYVFGVFNQADERLVPDPGNADIPRRIRQWKHLLPANWATNLWTYTPGPLSAGYILDQLLGASTVGSPWAGNYLGHDALNLPAYGLDFRGGVRLDSALVALCEKVGLQFTLSGFFQLKFRRKGEWLPGLGETFPTTVDGWYVFPANAKRTDGDNLRDGWALSGNPTRLRVVGDRNRYQVANLVLEPDWARAWDAWWDERMFLVWVFENLTAAIVGDTDDIVRWANAQQIALQLTVADVAAHAAGGAAYADRRKHAGVSRMQMPAMLYIRELVLRAWRLPATVLGRDTRSWQLSETMLCAVTHAVTGVMTQDITKPEPGNGYAIAQNYGLNLDMLTKFDPFRFRLEDWLVANRAWGVASFQMGGDAGDGVPYLIFEQPVYDPTGIGYQPDGPEGAFVFDALWEPQPPVVRACLSLLGETFYWPVGSGSIDAVVSEPELHGENVRDANGTVVGAIAYADGDTPEEKATALGNSLLLRQAIVHSGGYERVLDDGDGAFVLHGMYDRLTVTLADNGVTTERIDFTSERTFSSFQTERTYDRRVRSADLFPGQEALKAEQHAAKQYFGTVLTRADLRRQLVAARRGEKGDASGLSETSTLTLAGVTGATPRLPAGAPLWQVPGTATVRPPRPVLPSASGSTHKVLAGVTARANEDPRGEVPVRTSGRVLIRAQGPVATGDSLGRSDGHDYVVKDGGNACLVAVDEVATGEIRLIRADFGGGGGGNTVSARWR